MALHRAVFFLSAVQCSLCGHILCLTRGGVLVGLVGVRQILQELPAVGGKPLGQLNAVVGLEQVGLGLAQRGAVRLVFGNILLYIRRALFQIGHNEVGLVLHIGGALLLGHQPGQLAAAGGAFLGNFQAGVTAGDLLVQLVHNVGLSFFVGVVGLQQHPAQLGGSPCGKRVALGLHFGQVGGGLLVGTVADQRADVHQKYIVQTLTFLVGLTGVLDGGLTQALVVGGVKNAAQDGRAVRGRRVEQPGKVVLRQHRNLGKLFGVDAQQLDHGVGHGGRTADRLVRLTDQLGLGGHLDHAGAALGGALLVGPAAHGVAAPTVGKGQLDARLGVGGGKITAQHRCFPVLAGGLAVERKRDGVKQGGLARAGVAADQKQSAAAERREVQLGAARVGAEGGQDQLLGFHSLFDASSRNLFTATVSSTVRGRPFILVKKSWNSSTKGLPRTAWVMSSGCATSPWGR